MSGVYHFFNCQCCLLLKNKCLQLRLANFLQKAFTVLKDRSSKRERERIVYLKRPWGHVNCGDEHSQATFDQGKVTGTTSVQTRWYCIQ